MRQTDRDMTLKKKNKSELVIMLEVRLTCSRTLAVSSGNVTRSATQPADPAANTLTAAGGFESVMMFSKSQEPLTKKNE